MMISITILLIAISNAITAYYGAKRSDKLQEQIDRLNIELNNINKNTITNSYDLEDCFLFSERARERQRGERAGSAARHRAGTKLECPSRVQIYGSLKEKRLSPI